MELTPEKIQSPQPLEEQHAHQLASSEMEALYQP